MSCSHTLIAQNANMSLDRLFSVKNWVIVVTGGGTGLGLVTAAALVRNGARVYITGRRAEVLKEAVKIILEKAEGQGEVVALQGDCASKEGIESKCSTLPRLKEM